MATILNNFATLTYNSGDDTGAATSNVVSTNLLDSYALTVDKVSLNEDWRPGENITYLVTVTNTCTQPLFAVSVTDDMGGADAPLEYLERSAAIISDSGVTEVTPTSVSPLVIPVADVLSAGESVTVVYVAQVAADIADIVESITNTVFALGRQGSATGVAVESDTDSVTLPRADFAQVDIVKTVDKAVVSSGDTLTYTFTIENSGNIPATNVVIMDTLPAGFEITSISSVTNGVITVYDESDYTVSADNTLILPTGGVVTITVPARTAQGNGVTVVTVTGVVTG
ncbi:MAG: DUF11 domain-containing protein [Ruminococcaceae bacterium]|nr:DUF11 domain-containing protein [Oscillospiraceae bacterium]